MDSGHATSRILVAGCGYLGLALCQRFAGDGRRVWALRRSAAATDELARAGAVPLIADLTRPETLASLPPLDAVVACQAPGRNDEDRATYIDGTRHLIEAMIAHPPSRFVFVSSTSVYGHTGGEWVDETTPPRSSSARARTLLDAEVVACTAPWPTMVVRLAGLYGPGRDRTQLLRSGRVSAADRGYVNHIHVDDAAGIIALVLERGEPGQVYLGVDERPVERSVCYAWIAQRAGIAPPATGATAPRELGSKRCSNRKVATLGYRYRYPDYQAGFGALIAAPSQQTGSRRDG